MTVEPVDCLQTGDPKVKSNVKVPENSELSAIAESLMINSNRKPMTIFARFMVPLPGRYSAGGRINVMLNVGIAP